MVVLYEGSSDRRQVFCRITEKGLAVLAVLDTAVTAAKSQANSLPRGERLWLVPHVWPCSTRHAPFTGSAIAGYAAGLLRGMSSTCRDRTDRSPRR